MLNVEVLDISLGGRPAGKLFRFANGTTSPIVRFVADDDFAADPRQATLSASMRARDPAQQAALWKDLGAPIFNGPSGCLPAFFQNMLPEGVFRTQLAQERGCREDDHFALYAACGLDLPGAVKALPAQLSRQALARLVTQENDALEMSVTADPLPLGVSISGMQPKVGVIEQGGRYVARKRDGVTRIIGKLPQAERPFLPEVEDLSLSLAQAAGADVAEHRLVPLQKLDFHHGYTLGGSGNFLAVTRFDRAGAKRIHCEDFAQALGVEPRNKYTGASYAAMAGLMLRYPESLGSGAVHELLRLITINELMGNLDAHLKNFCLLYPDGPHAGAVQGLRYRGMVCLPHRPGQCAGALPRRRPGPAQGLQDTGAGRIARVLQPRRHCRAALRPGDSGHRCPGAGALARHDRRQHAAGLAEGTPAPALPGPSVCAEPAKEVRQIRAQRCPPLNSLTC